MPGEPPARGVYGPRWLEQHAFALESQGWGTVDKNDLPPGLRKIAGIFCTQKLKAA